MEKYPIASNPQSVCIWMVFKLFDIRSSWEGRQTIDRKHNGFLLSGIDASHLPIRFFRPFNGIHGVYISLL